MADGPVWSFKTAAANHPPNTPSTPSGPSSGSVGTSYNFSSSATDPDGDSIAIQFDLGDGATSSWSSFVSSGQSVSMSYSWASPGTYTVKAKAKDSKGAESDWSGPKAITISGGNLKWRFQTGNSVIASPAIGSDGAVYIGSDSYLLAINPNGTLKWRYPTGGLVDSSPAIGSDGTIYVGSKDGYLYVINSDGTLKWRYRSGNELESSPAIGSDGTIYVGSYDCYLYAIQGSGTLANTPWPMFHHDLTHNGRVGGP